MVYFYNAYEMKVINMVGKLRESYLVLISLIAWLRFAVKSQGIFSDWDREFVEHRS